MSGIDQDTIFGVTRLEIEYRSPEGEIKRGKATGFLLTLGDGNTGFFITNRHVLDPTYKCPERAGWVLASAKIEIREYTKQPRIKPLDNTIFLPLKNLNAIIFPDDDSDVGIIVNPPVDPMPKTYALRTAGSIDNLADETFFKNSIQMMDFVSFIGFPEDLYDTNANLPIARIATIASRPDRNFENKYIKGEVVLINGLSFQRSSGSPVFSHQKDFKISGSNTRLPIDSKILGIVVGGIRGEMHTGLSYFVKSTIILKLLTSRGFIKK